MDLLEADVQGRRGWWALLRGVAWDVASLRRQKRLPNRAEYCDPQAGTPTPQSEDRMRDTLKGWTLSQGGQIVDREPSQ
jgi:hypothetical protein